MEKWAPDIRQIYKPGGGALDDMLEEILQLTAELDVCEVRTLHSFHIFYNFLDTEILKAKCELKN